MICALFGLGCSPFQRPYCALAPIKSTTHPGPLTRSLSIRGRIVVAHSCPAPEHVEAATIESPDCSALRVSSP